MQFDEDQSEIDIDLSATWDHSEADSPLEIWIDACAAWGDTQKVWTVSGQALPDAVPGVGITYRTGELHCRHKHDKRGWPWSTRLDLRVTYWNSNTGVIAVQGRWQDGADSHPFAGELSLRARSE